MIFNIALDDTIIPGKTVPRDIGLNIMFWGVFDSVTCDSVTEKIAFYLFLKMFRLGHYHETS